MNNTHGRSAMTRFRFGATLGMLAALAGTANAFVVADSLTPGVPSPVVTFNSTTNSYTVTVNIPPRGGAITATEYSYLIRGNASDRIAAVRADYSGPGSTRPDAVRLEIRGGSLGQRVGEVGVVYSTNGPGSTPVPIIIDRLLVADDVGPVPAGITSTFALQNVASSMLKSVEVFSGTSWRTTGECATFRLPAIYLAM